jgi:NhaP-type Na+/H+ or K+/H+ antiporter
MIITLFQGLFAFGFTFFALFVLGLPFHIALVIGSLAIATEPGPILLITKKLRSKGPLSDTLVPLHGLEDVITIMMFGMAISYAVSVEKNLSFTLSDILWGPVAELIFSILIAFAIGYVFVRIIRFLKYEDKEKDLVILVSAFVAIMAAISISHLGFELFHHHIHLSPILVPMGVGITFSILSTNLAKHETERVMDGFSGPLYIAFFTVLGAEIVMIVFYSLEIINLLTMIGIALVYVLFRMFGKIVGSYVGGKFAKSNKNVSKYLGFCLLPQAQAAIGLALYAHSKLNFTIYGTLLLIVIMISSIVNEIIGPLGVRYSLIKCNEASLDEVHKTYNHLDEHKH